MLVRELAGCHGGALRPSHRSVDSCVCDGRCQAMRKFNAGFFVNTGLNLGGRARLRVGREGCVFAAFAVFSLAFIFFLAGSSLTKPQGNVREWGECCGTVSAGIISANVLWSQFPKNEVKAYKKLEHASKGLNASDTVDSVLLKVD